jgi:hypothetical protein
MTIINNLDIELANVTGTLMMEDSIREIAKWYEIGRINDTPNEMHHLDIVFTTE